MDNDTKILLQIHIHIHDPTKLSYCLQIIYNIKARKLLSYVASHYGFCPLIAPRFTKQEFIYMPCVNAKKVY